MHRYLDPIYYGDYPKVMREKLGDRLPEFSEEDIELLRNSVDFVGLNHYTTRFIAHANESPEESDFYKAQQMERFGNVQISLVFFFLLSCVKISDTYPILIS